MKKWHFIVAGILLISTPICVVIGYNLLMETLGYVWIPSCTGNGGHWRPREFYDGEQTPDGWYWVQSGWESINGTVTFPYCPSSGTRLHGTWKTSIYLPDNYEGYVRVENQIIVERKP